MDNQNRPIILRVVIQMLVFVVYIPLLPLLITRQWSWWEAWAYSAVNTLGFVVSRLMVVRRHPDLIAERARFMRHENTQPWDKILAPLVNLGAGLVPCAAGLDRLLDGSTAFSLPLKITALALIAIGFAWSTYALVENRFFSGMVRLQTDRGHQVVSGGPYRFMRHPGYAGGILVYLASPLLLESFWALLVAVVLVALLALRTSLEDRFLQENLLGYADYAARVRYRLLPGVW
jgi:protein-S-isoprenylcysteine O-methyltransferase Ste14